MEIAVQATPQHLEDVHQVLARFWREVDRVWPRPPDSTWRAQFDTGVGEISANIVQYAYPCSTPGTLTFRLRAFDHSIEACFSDTGRPYEPYCTAGDADSHSSDPVPLAEGGRGIQLAQAAVDQLTYERTPGGTNHWCLSKRSR